jgi:hypothetical protein
MSIVTYNNRSLQNVTDLASVTKTMVLLSTQTASSSATISFTSDIDATYPAYMFKFIDIHPATDGADFQFQGNAVGESGFNETITSSVFKGGHDESDTAGQAKIQYESGSDQAQGTGFQTLGISSGSDDGQSTSGYLHLFNPSSTTFVKHFIARIQSAQQNNYSFDTYIAGYFNTTSAIDEIQFKFASGNIDSGVIKLYGIKDS